MGKLDHARRKKNEGVEEVKKQCRNLDALAKDAERVADVAGNATVIINDLDVQFKKATKLDDFDIKFLFLATALQCIRQYVIGTLTQRNNHNESDTLAHEIQKNLFNIDENNGSRKNINEYRMTGARYRATTEEIMYSLSVPYDITGDTKLYGVGGINARGEKMGLSGVNHRYKTLGHDPFFGWIFGTSNIMTNTLTNNLGMTFHVKNSQIVSHGGYDKTIKMFEHVKLRSREEPKDLGICIIKQGLHLMSDTYSKGGIALPGTVRIDSELASTLASYGVDFGNVIKTGHQAGYAVLINKIIAMIHGLYYDKRQYSSWSIYSVKTRKIIRYSNIIATSSNIVAVGIGSLCGCATGNMELIKKSLNYLDIGGIVVAITQLFKDRKFLYDVKREFLEKEFHNIVMGNLELED